MKKIRLFARRLCHLCLQISHTVVSKYNTKMCACISHLHWKMKLPQSTSITPESDVYYLWMVKKKLTFCLFLWKTPVNSFHSLCAPLHQHQLSTLLKHYFAPGTESVLIFYFFLNPSLSSTPVSKCSWCESWIRMNGRQMRFRLDSRFFVI